MNKVLIVNPSYLPGFKSGGPQQTVQNICDVFKKTNDIYLVTMNRDYGETRPYDLETNKWLKLYGINIMYVEPEKYNLKLFRSLYKEFSTILACGLFCSSTIQLMLINNNRHKRLYIAPMGVFGKNALAIRSTKKRIFLKCFSIMGVFKKILWSFTSENELNEAKNAIGVQNIKKFIVAEDIPRFIDFKKSKKELLHKGNILRIVFLSRIVPIKNLLYAIKILNNQFHGNIQFDIYGLKEDKNYWKLCESEMEKLPSNVICKYCGPVKPNDSISVFACHDIFLFPTQGENFGHVIYESLAAGCLPLISDTTPWRDFDEKKCGNVVQLDDMEGFRKCIQTYFDMQPDEFENMKINAINYAEKKYISSVEKSGYRAIFDAPVSHVCGYIDQ